MKTTLISIVIPVRNRAEQIVRCLESVRNQSVRPLNIIVVDNGSSDNTKTVVENWVSKNCNENFSITLIEEPDPGAAIARNRGLEIVDTEWVLFFDSDDVMNPDLLSKVTTRIHTDPDLDLIYWDCIYKTSGGRVQKRHSFSTRNLFKKQIYNSLLCTISYAVKTEFIRKAGGWNSQLKGWDDWELGIRLMLGKPKITAINDALSIIYSQPESITGINYQSKAGIWETAIDASENDINNSDLSDQDRIKLTRMVNYRRANLAALYRKEGRSDFAAPLLKQALSHPTTTGFRKLLLRFIYAYTASGGRMGYILWH